MKYCNNCGKELGSNSNVCPNCGVKSIYNESVGSIGYTLLSFLFQL